MDDKELEELAKEAVEKNIKYDDQVNEYDDIIETMKDLFIQGYKACREREGGRWKRIKAALVEAKDLADDEGWDELENEINEILEDKK